jgi:hypothetical protein
MPEPRPNVDDYIAKVPPALHAVAAELRRLVRAAAPDATESIKWGQPVYDAGGPFAALKAYPRWITLTFWRGAALPDPEGVLEGDGDRMRHARFSDVGQVRADAIAELVGRAVAMNRELGDPTRRDEPSRGKVAKAGR